MTLLIFIAGLLVGFLAGVAFNDALTLMRQRPEPDSTGDLMRRFAHWVADRLRLVIVAVVVLSNLALGALLIQQRAASEDFTTCSAQYSTDFARSYTARATAAAEVSGAVDEIVMAIAAGQDARPAVENYVKLRTKQDNQRERSPLPEPPSQVCGEPTK